MKSTQNEKISQIDWFVGIFAFTRQNILIALL